MKMTMKQALDAYIGIMAISKAILPGPIAKKLFDAREELDKQRRFYAEEEEKLIKKYCGKSDDDGKITFDTAEHSEEYNKKIYEMMNIEVDVNIEYIGTIDANLVNVSVDGIYALKDIITIE